MAQYDVEDRLNEAFSHKKSKKKTKQVPWYKKELTPGLAWILFVCSLFIVPRSLLPGILLIVAIIVQVGALKKKRK